MFLEELAITMLSMVITLPFIFLILSWLFEQFAAILDMTLGDWIALGVFLCVATIITLIA